MVTLRVQNSGPIPLRDARGNGEPDARSTAQSGVQPVDRLARILGTSAPLREAVQRARLFANVQTPLLLQGETGAGKELFARAIHDSGLQRQGLFVALNCAGLPHDALASELFGHTTSSGKIEAAHGGTLFLDEIAELPLDLQAYLLRVLESGEVCALGSHRARSVRFRLISSCNRELRREVKRGRFRMDLFYRISVTSLEIPPLRERTEDLAELAAHFGCDAAERFGLPSKSFTPEVLAAFARYAWPGNVRELRNVVEAMVLTSGVSNGESIDTNMLPRDPFGTADEPAENANPGALYLGVEALEYNSIGAAIRMYEGNLTQAAKSLRIARSTLYLKMKKYSLEMIRDEVRYGTR